MDDVVFKHRSQCPIFKSVDIFQLFNIFIGLLIKLSILSTLQFLYNIDFLFYADFPQNKHSVVWLYYRIEGWVIEDDSIAELLGYDPVYLSPYLLLLLLLLLIILPSLARTECSDFLVEVEFKDVLFGKLVRLLVNILNEVLNLALELLR